MQNPFADRESFIIYTMKRIDSTAEAAKIALSYGIIGYLWILFSDRLIHTISPNSETVLTLQTVKGWFFVTVTMILYFWVVKNKIKTINANMIKLDENLQELSATYEELQAVEEELRSSVEDLEESRMQYKKLAYYDNLTGLPNRNMFEQRGEFFLSDAKIKGSSMAVIYMDIDNFKYINDIFGHLTGDLFLKEISFSLNESIQSSDFIAKASGDEFIIIFNDVKDKADIEQRIKKVTDNVRKPWHYNEQEFFISVSIGIGIYPDNADDLNTLLKNADTAMFVVKAKGKDSYCFYDEDIKKITSERIATINEMRACIRKNELMLLYQPIYDILDNKVVGTEALVRWNNAKRGCISPMEFIPLAEETGFISDISIWVAQTAFRQNMVWNDIIDEDFKVSINISAVDLKSSDFIEMLKICIDQYGIKGSNIQLEITETAIMTDIERNIQNLTELKNLGVIIALDDFGAGYSSLTYLKKLPIDILKMDRMFIQNITNNDDDNEIVKTVIKLAHILNIKVVAEGIETKQQLELLISHGCDMGQGYYFSRPVSFADIKSLTQ